MTGPGKWSLEGDAPEAAEFPAESYADQMNDADEKAAQSERGYDERGNVRPADERADELVKPDEKPKAAKKAVAKK